MQRKVVTTPREKLLTKGPKKLSNAEILSVIWSSGTAKESVFGLAARICKFYDNKTLAGLDTKFYNSGIMPKVKFLQLLASVELGRRVFVNPGELGFKSPEEIFRYYSHLANLPREEVRVLHFDPQQKLIQAELVAVGSVMNVYASPREIIRSAIQNNAVAIVLLHNHPSGDCKPSTQDLEFTQVLKQALGLVQIELHDHIIIGKSFFSFAQAGYLKG